LYRTIDNLIAMKALIFFFSLHVREEHASVPTKRVFLKHATLKVFFGVTKRTRIFTCNTSLLFSRFVPHNNSKHTNMQLRHVVCILFVCGLAIATPFAVRAWRADEFPELHDLLQILRSRGGSVAATLSSSMPKIPVMSSSSSTINQDHQTHQAPAQLQVLYQRLTQDTQPHVRFHPGDLVRWKQGLQNMHLPAPGEVAVVTRVLSPTEAQSLTSMHPNNEADSSHFREPLNVVIGILDHADDTLHEYYVDGRRLEIASSEINAVKPAKDNA
jgi:hypothetical protein